MSLFSESPGNDSNTKMIERSQVRKQTQLLIKLLVNQLPAESSNVIPKPHCFIYLYKLYGKEMSERILRLQTKMDFVA